MKITALKFDPRNANKGTDRGRKALAASLEQFGAGRSILVDKNGTVIAGNKTLAQAIARGDKEVTVIKTDGKQIIAVQRTDLDLRDAKAKGLAIADNRVAELDLDWDQEALAAINKDIDLSPFWSPDELGELLGIESAPAPEAKLDQADALQKKWNTERSQVWEIGKHRLMCGDCTIEADVKKLMGKKKAALMNTDPPYGVSLRLEDNHAASNSAKGIKKTYRHFENIMGDELEGEKLQEFLESCFRTAITVLRPNAAWYLWHAQLSQGFFAAAAAAAQLLVHRQIIWVKPHFVFGRGDYHWQHELCFYGWIKGNRPEFYGKRNQSTTWSLSEGGGSIRKDQNHPTQKPVELFTIPILNHLKLGEIAYEPFAGSGTQLCAAEQTKRVCYALEIEPKYVAVALERLSDMGLKPKLAS